MLKVKQNENEVKRAIKEYLEFNGWKVRRINNAGIFRGYNKKGDKRFSFDGDSGVSDLHCTKSGINQMWIECKATGKKPTLAQENFIKDINSTLDGIAFWCDSFEMFLPIYQDIRNGYGLPKSYVGQ